MYPEVISRILWSQDDEYEYMCCILPENKVGFRHNFGRQEHDAGYERWPRRYTAGECLMNCVGLQSERPIVDEIATEVVLESVRLWHPQSLRLDRCHAGIVTALFRFSDT
jgi:hypothetical protein